MLAHEALPQTVTVRRARHERVSRPHRSGFDQATHRRRFVLPENAAPLRASRAPCFSFDVILTTLLHDMFQNLRRSPARHHVVAVIELRIKFVRINFHANDLRRSLENSFAEILAGIVASASTCSPRSVVPTTETVTSIDPIFRSAETNHHCVVEASPPSDPYR